MAFINGYVNTNQVQGETAKAYLFKLVGSDWLVWVPASCVRGGSHSANLSAGVVDDRDYNIFRNGKGRFNSFEKPH